MGLSASGLLLPTGPEILDLMVEEFEALTGLTLDTTNPSDQFVMMVFLIATQHLVATHELIQAIYDGTRVDTAEGLQLEDNCYLVGIEPDPATYSSATVTPTGTAGTVIPQGSIVEGGGPNDDARWITSEDLTLPGSVVVVAQEAGPIEASIGQIDKIVTSVPGWSTVSNAAAASVGQTREGGTTLRQRRRIALQVGAAASSAAIRSAILNLDFVDECIVIQNTSNIVAVVSGKTMDPNSIWIFLTPDTLTTEQEDELAALIHRKVAAGTKTMGSGLPTEVSRTVTDAGGHTSRLIKLDYGAEVTTTITATVTLEPGYALSDVESAIEDAITEYMDGFGMGAVLRSYDLIVATEGIEGIANISFAASIGALPYTPAIDQIIVMTSISVV